MPTPVVVSSDQRLLEPALGRMTENEQVIMHRWMLTSSQIWVAMIHDEIACCWGFVPPTLLSEEAYLWMYHTPIVEQHKFLFVRNSQLIRDKVLLEYPLIYGHVKASAVSSRRWLKWLGATFGEQVNGMLRFEIRKRANG